MDTITLKHTLTGKVAKYPIHYFTDGLLGEFLVPTDEDEQCVDCVVPHPDPEEEDEVIPTPFEVFGENPADFDVKEDK